MTNTEQPDSIESRRAYMAFRTQNGWPQIYDIVSASALVVGQLALWFDAMGLGATGIVRTIEPTTSTQHPWKLDIEYIGRRTVLLCDDEPMFVVSV